MQRLNRVTPAMPAGAYKTYTIAAPLATHWVAATCEQAGCRAWQVGWRTIVDEATDLGAAQAAYIRGDRSRGHTEHRDGPLTVFAFPAGQRCFRAADHRRRLDRPERYVVRGGDWRGNPDGRAYTHSGPDAWVDDFATHQQHITDKLGRG